MIKANFEVRFKSQGETLAAYKRDRNRVSVIIGPLGSGKTIETCQKLFTIATEQEPDENNERRSRIYAVRNTYSDLFNTTIKDWRELFGHLGSFSEGGKKPPEHKLFFKLEDGTKVRCEVIFLALDKPQHVRKLRGAQATVFWLNELKELPKSIIDMCDLRHGRYPKNPTWHGMVADTNAPDTDHWLYKTAEEIRPSTWSVFKQPGGLMRQGILPSGRVNWVINPDAENIQNLPGGYKYYTTPLADKDDDWIAVNLANEYGFVKDGKPVFSDYNDEVHCRDFELNGKGQLIRGWDFGIAACTLMELTPAGRLLIRHEWLADQTMGIDVMAEQVLRDCKVFGYEDAEFLDIGDPAGEARSMQKDEVTCFGVLHDMGIDVQAGVQTLAARLMAVQYYLRLFIGGLPCLMVHPDCKMVRKGFQGGYCFERVAVGGTQDRFKDKPVKNKYSHLMDTIQYVCTFLRNGYNDEPDDSDSGQYQGNRGRSRVGGY